MEVEQFGSAEELHQEPAKAKKQYDHRPLPRRRLQSRSIQPWKPRAGISQAQNASINYTVTLHQLALNALFNSTKKSTLANCFMRVLFLQD